jgi:hypothetical protein
MPPINPAYLAHQRKRWMPPNAHLFIRPDWRRFVRPADRDDHPFALYERKYSADQPRVPAGSREGGQWTDGEGNSGQSGRTDPHVISDASPDPFALVRSMPKMGREEVFPAASSLTDSVSNRPLANRLDCRSSKPRLRTLFGASRNWTRTGAQNPVLMKASKVSSLPFAATPSKPRLEFRSCKARVLGRGHSLASPLQHGGRSGTSRQRSAVRLIASALRLDVILAGQRSRERRPGIS